MSPNLYLYHYNLCGNFCPSCNGIQESMIKRVSRVDLQNFLVVKMIQNTHQRYTPTQLATHLNQYPQAGKLIYGRSTPNLYR